MGQRVHPFHLVTRLLKEIENIYDAKEREDECGAVADPDLWCVEDLSVAEQEAIRKAVMAAQRGEETHLRTRSHDLAVAVEIVHVLSGVNRGNLFEGWLTEEDFQKLHPIIEEVAELPLTVELAGRRNKPGILAPPRLLAR